MVGLALPAGDETAFDNVSDDTDRSVEAPANGDGAGASLFGKLLILGNPFPFCVAMGVTMSA